MSLFISLWIMYLKLLRSLVRTAVKGLQANGTAIWNRLAFRFLVPPPQEQKQERRVATYTNWTDERRTRTRCRTPIATCGPMMGVDPPLGLVKKRWHVSRELGARFPQSFFGMLLFLACGGVIWFQETTKHTAHSSEKPCIPLEDFYIIDHRGLVLLSLDIFIFFR